MGITNFYSWLLENYSECISQNNTNNNNYDNIFIDINPILHISIASNGLRNQNDIIKKIENNINTMLNYIKPNKKIIFSTDGIPSIAKLILQRERRIEMIKKINNSELDNITNEKFINPIIFTPGTIFMNELSSKLENYFNKLKEKYKNIEIINLIDIEQGESEFKLFNYLLNNIKNEKSILISNDADVIIMALSIINKENEISIGRIINKTFNIININKFYELLKGNTDKSNLDYVLILLLLGNDYLPKLNYVDINKLLEYLNKVKSKLIINNNNYLEINYDLFEKLLFKLYNKSRYFKHIPIYEIEYNKINNYLTGLTWCLNNYSTSSTQNQYYMFNYKKLGINPYELWKYTILIKKNPIKYPNENKININKNIYSSLVIPYKIKFIIEDNKYIDYIYKNYKKYYSEELCKICNELNKKSLEFNETKKFLNIMNDNNSETDVLDNLKISITENNKKILEHKKNHKLLEKKDYMKIIQKMQLLI